MSGEENIPKENFTSTNSKKGENEAVTQDQSQPEIEPKSATMEVHKHPHHITHKKRWGEYFLEFMMIFLAVFLGFVAENWRENIFDRRREKELMMAFVNDLKLDTTQLSQLVRGRRVRSKQLDSTIVFYSKQTFPTVSLKTYQLSIRLFGLNSFYQNTGTLDQLKNSGGFRFIRHRQIVDTIEKYDALIKRMAIRDALETQITIRQRELVEKFFDGKSLSKIFADSILFTRKAEAEGSFLRTSPLMINVNPQYIGEYLNVLIDFRRLHDADTEIEEQMKDIAAHLINLIEKKYRLRG